MERSAGTGELEANGLWLLDGSNRLYNEVVENAQVVTERRQGGRTGIPNRKLSLKTRVDGGSSTCPQDWQ